MNRAEWRKNEWRKRRDRRAGTLDDATRLALRKLELEDAGTLGSIAFLKFTGHVVLAHYQPLKHGAR